MVDNNLAAPCGIYCGACRQYLLWKKDLLEERGYKMGCKGCRIRNKNCAFIRRDCIALKKKKLDYCYECEQFPCQNLQEIDSQYQERWSVNLIENLKRIEEFGVEKWLQEQSELYKCPECGGEICVHDTECYNCGLKYNPNKKSELKMTEDILKELDADGLRSVFLKYTREAYDSIPKIDNPRILDIGCGTGIPTLELARLSNGKITGIDIDQEALDKLNFEIKKRGLSERIKTYNRSIYNTQFDDQSFDILWEEGVVHLLDLKRTLTECSRIVKLNGFMVTGEANNWAMTKLKHFPRFGFKLIKEIPWESECWWTQYYAPLEVKINQLRDKYDNIDNIEEIHRHLMEIEMVKKNPAGFDCITYVMQKIK